MGTTTSPERGRPTRRERLRMTTLEEIKSLAKEQLALAGPGALSLRAISREMGMASSALYRYYASQDALVDALCVDAWNSLAYALERARDELDPDDHAGRIYTIWHAHRQWALDNHPDFVLIFGTPVPGYQAEPEVTGPAAGRFATVLGRVYADAVDAGAADPSRTQVPATLQTGELFGVLLADALPDHPPQQAGIVLTAWASIYGFLIGEIFGSLRLLIDNCDELFAAHVRTVVLGMGYQAPSAATGR